MRKHTGKSTLWTDKKTMRILAEEETVLRRWFDDGRSSQKRCEGPDDEPFRTEEEASILGRRDDSCS